MLGSLFWSVSALWELGMMSTTLIPPLAPEPIAIDAASAGGVLLRWSMIGWELPPTASPSVEVLSKARPSSCSRWRRRPRPHGEPRGEGLLRSRAKYMADLLSEDPGKSLTGP